jgi:hypothetical protein
LVRGNGPVNVCIREVLPEWFHKRFDASPCTSLKKASRVTVKGVECLEDGIKITKPRRSIWWVISEFITMHWATRTLPCEASCGKNLFRIVADEGGKQWVASSNQAVTTCHRHTRNAGLFKWL